MKRYIIAALAAVLALTACKETDIDLFYSPVQEAGAGSIAVTAATVSRLEISWQPVSGVTQYGYTLSDPTGRAVRQGVTRETTLTLENLEENTSYTFVMEALGTNGEPTMRYTTTMSTAGTVRLPAPDVKSTVVDFADGHTTITWPPVDHAEYYTYALDKADGTEILDGETTDNFLEFGSMAIGDYVLRLTACTTEEGYLDSETALFNFRREHQVVETHSGTYKSAVLGDFECALDIYDDGVMAIRSFLGVEGYDLEFSISSDKVISILNYYYEEGNYKYVATGVAGNETLLVYQDPAYCTYSVLPTGKRIRLYVYLGDSDTGAYDTFTWK